VTHTVPTAESIVLARGNVTDLIRGGTIVAPTAYDVFSARIIEEAGFDAVFCSGYGLAASALGQPDRGALTLEILTERVRVMAGRLRVPLLVDADTGFHNPAETVAQLAAAGAAAVMIEDQIADKRCGHLDGKAVVSLEEMLERLGAAVAGRPPGLSIIARTDAIEPLGLDAALSRALAFADAGADIVFVEAPRSIVELREIARTVDCPLMVNVIPGGKTPVLKVADLAEMGFKLVVFGLVDLMFAGAALQRGFSELANTGDIFRVLTPRLGFEELNVLTGLTASTASAAPPRA
jgi:2-methylisocitrate lyase-like PEP mutase family enzyme